MTTDQQHRFQPIHIDAIRSGDVLWRRLKGEMKREGAVANVCVYNRTTAISFSDGFRGMYGNGTRFIRELDG